jgi:hypothetical protein
MILRHPERYYSVFLKANIIEYWRNPSNHTYTLFREKYTRHWEKFCVREGLATLSDEGVVLPKQLAFTYMTFLAQAIADGKGISPITDYRNLDRLFVITRTAEANLKKKVNVARSIINLKLPENLSNISFDELIRFRNRDSFKARLKAFHTELDTFLAKLEVGETASDFTDSFRSVWKDFTGQIVSLGAGVATLGLGVWVLASNAQAATPELLKGIVAGASVVGSSISLSSTWTNTRTRRYCRKYLADMRRIRA